MNTIPCVLCGEHSSEVAITENGYTGLRCPQCRLVYVSPRPDAERTLNLYSHEHRPLYAEAQFSFEEVNRKAARQTIEHIKALHPGGTLLELGPGAGFFLEEARTRGYDVHGIELNPTEAEAIRNRLGIPCEERPLGTASFGGKKFDVIYHKDVLSHLWDPIAVFQDIHRALNDGGLLVFETGNIGDLDRKYYKYFSQFLYPDHLFFFGERSIQLLLERTGFRVVEVVRHAILLQLLLQKALWRVKDSLKDRPHTGPRPGNGGSAGHLARRSIKRRLRNSYRVVSLFLVRTGTAVLPKTNRPLKLVVYAAKDGAKGNGS